MKLWFSALSLWWQLGLEAAALAAIAGIVWGVYHHIEMNGYNKCQGQYQAAAQAQAATAQKEITKTEAKYDALKAAIPKTAAYSRPVSPLVAHAIGSMPRPSHGAK